MEKIQRILKTRCDIFAALSHFLLSFCWQGKVFIYDKGWSDYLTTVRDTNVISDVHEAYLVYILSRAFCLLILWGGVETFFLYIEWKY